MRTYYEHQDWTARFLAGLMKSKRIYLDDAFQSYHRWVTENNQQYMRSLLNGKAPTPIYVADIEACRNSIRLKYDENHEDYDHVDDHDWSVVLMIMTGDGNDDSDDDNDVA